MTTGCIVNMKEADEESTLPLVAIYTHSLCEEEWDGSE